MAKTGHIPWEPRRLKGHPKAPPLAEHLPSGGMAYKMITRCTDTYTPTIVSIAYGIYHDHI